MPIEGIKWGEDLRRDCRELRRLEAWGIYRHGWHDEHCALQDHDSEKYSYWMVDTQGEVGPHPVSKATAMVCSNYRNWIVWEEIEEDTDKKEN